MFSTWKVVASSGGDSMTMSRSSLRMRCTRLIAFLALAAGSTVKTWSYLFLKYRASFARRPASAGATGDDSRPVVDTVSKSTAYDIGRPYPSSWAIRVSWGHSSTTKIAEPTKANQNGAVTPKWVASAPPIAEPATRPPKTQIVLTLVTRPWR